MQKQGILVIVFVLGILLPISGFAQINLNLDYPEFGGFDLEEDQGLPEVIAFFYYFIVGIAGLAAFVMLVWGGVQWLMSGAIPAQANEARDKVRNAILGLLLVLASFLLVQVINPELTVIRSDVLDAGTRIAPEYQTYEHGSYTSAPPGQTKKGFYLCDRANCAGGEFLRIDLTGGCLATPDLSNATALQSAGCIEHSNSSTGNWNDWDKRIRSVRINAVDPSGFILFDKPSPTFDVTERVICFRGSVDNLDLYNIKPDEGWGEKTGGFLGLSGSTEACKNPGLTYLNYQEDYNEGQPAVFFFDKVAYGQQEGTARELPLERWKAGAEDGGKRSDHYGHGRHGDIRICIGICKPPRVKSLWITNEILCGPDTQPPPSGDGVIGPDEQIEACAVRLWSKETMNPSTDANICFKSSEEDLSQYNFKCTGNDDLTDDIKGVQVIPASECVLERETFSCD